ncbi:MAG: DsbA family protein [Anaerolineae bacterium]
MGQDRVERLQEEYDVEVEWRAFELHPETPPEGMRLPWADDPRYEAMAERLREMAAKAGLPMNPPAWISNSRRALEAAEYAREQGKHQAFHDAVFRAYFAEGQDIGDWGVLQEIAEAVDLDGTAMREAVERGAYRAGVDAQIGEARRLRITGVPTYILGNLAVVGAQPYEVFQRAMARLEAEARQRAG